MGMIPSSLERAAIEGYRERRPISLQSYKHASVLSDIYQGVREELDLSGDLDSETHRFRSLAPIRMRASEVRRRFFGRITLCSTKRTYQSKVDKLAQALDDVFSVLYRAHKTGRASQYARKAYINALRKAIKLEKEIRILETQLNEADRYALARSDRPVLDASTRVIRILSKAHYTSPSLTDLDKRCADVVRKKFTREKAPRKGFAVKMRHLQRSFQAYKSDERSSLRLSSKTGIGFDANEDIVAAKVCTLKMQGHDGRPFQTDYLKMPGATVTPWFTSEVDPIFESYVDSLEEGECHVYFNFQDRSSFMEGKRCHTLESYADRLNAQAAREASRSKLFLLTLPHNGAFYKQSDITGDVNYGDFERDFIRRMRNNESGFYIGQGELRDRVLTRANLQTILRAVKNQYFHSGNILSQIDRQDFIDLAYNAIMRHVLKTLKPKSFNASCKSDKDRGGMRRTLFLQEQIYRANNNPVIHLPSRPRGVSDPTGDVRAIHEREREHDRREAETERQLDTLVAIAKATPFVAVNSAMKSSFSDRCDRVAARLEREASRTEGEEIQLVFAQSPRERTERIAHTLLYQPPHLSRT